MQLYNSSKRQKQPFTPIKPGELSLYVCGVTVYDLCHIGHARVACFFDTLARYFESKNYTVKFVRNITDIDDKIIARANEQGVPFEALTQKYEAAMRHDFSRLNARAPWKEPKATEFVDEIIALIQSLITKGYAYKADNGDVYFSVNAFDNYGKLSNQSLEDLLSGARVEANILKDNPLDFVLWKAAKPGEPSWASDWGKGRPGWHIECSAMATSCLGSTIDIHGGGHDLLFPHHENEIAQSEASTDKPFVHYWMHVGFVKIDNEKMSKSLGNFFTIDEVLKKYHPEVLRYFLISSHYRSPLNYSDASLNEAKKALMRLYGPLKQKKDLLPVPNPIGDYLTRFEQAMEDDFNTPVALAVMFDLVGDMNRNPEDVDARGALLLHMGQILGLMHQPIDGLFQTDDVDAGWVEALINERNSARAEKNWTRADEIRDKLVQAGIILEDASGKTTWRKI